MSLNFSFGRGSETRGQNEAHLKTLEIRLRMVDPGTNQ